MLSGHVVGGCLFWPYPCDKFSCPASFPAEPFRWVGSLLGLNSDNPGSGSRRFAPAKPSQLPRASFLKDRIQVQAPTSFHSALYQMGQTRSLACSIRGLAGWSFPVFFGEKVNVPPAGRLGTVLGYSLNDSGG